MKNLFDGEQMNEEACKFVERIHSATKDIVLEILTKGYPCQEVEILCINAIYGAFYSSAIKKGVKDYETIEKAHQLGRKEIQNDTN